MYLDLGSISDSTIKLPIFSFLNKFPIQFFELTNCKNPKTYEISWKISSNSFETRQSNQTDKTCCKCHPKNPLIMSGIDSNGLNEKEPHYGHGDNKLGTQNAVDFFDKSATNIVL